MDEHLVLLAQLTRACKNAIQDQSDGNLYAEPLRSLITTYCDLLRTRLIVAKSVKKKEQEKADK